jgi:type IV pilus assembly protein PilM
MRSFVQNLWPAKSNPIGIDFGSDCLRVAQVRKESNQLRLLAAEHRDVPTSVGNNWNARRDFFAQSLREILSEGKFVGRQAVLGLPAAATHIAHMRLAKADPKALEEALRWEVQGKLPFEASQAVLRHIVAGEVFVDQEARDEVIVFACRREMVEGLIGAAEKARIDVVGMNVEISAIVECFAQLYRRKGDAEAINCFLDIGSAGSRVIISCGRKILFVRAIAVGCAYLNSAVAEELHIGADETALLRRRLADRPVEEMALISSESHLETAVADDRRHDLREIASEPAEEEITQAGKSTVDKIVDEFTLCQRYYESAFPGNAIERLIFVGGGAADRRLCQEIARGIGLPAQVGDPLVRVEGREIIDAGVKRPQPAWAVAIGLSAGGIP